MVNPDTLQVDASYKLPDDGEPMYPALTFISFNGGARELWVGDRKNDAMVIIKLIKNQLVPAATLPMPRGVFHSLHTQDLYSERPTVITTCDIDNVTIVHDIATREVLCRLERPEQVASAQAKPHDATSDGFYHYVTFLGGTDDVGFVAVYDISTCGIVTVKQTGGDPHIAIRPNTLLFVPAQNGRTVTSFKVPSLKQRTATMLSSPHGTQILYNGKFFYTTNIADGGNDAIRVFRVANGREVSCPKIDTSNPIPHNIASTFVDDKIVITHSGNESDVNSVWRINRRTGCLIPGSERVFVTGLNPFGISSVPPTEESEIRALQRRLRGSRRGSRKSRIVRGRFKGVH